MRDKLQPSIFKIQANMGKAQSTSSQAPDKHQASNRQMELRIRPSPHFGFNSPSNCNNRPARVVKSAVLAPSRIWQGLPRSERSVAAVSLPSRHARSTVNPPRARRPEAEPFSHAFGNAGSNSIIRISDFGLPSDFGFRI